MQKRACVKEITVCLNMALKIYDNIYPEASAVDSRRYFIIRVLNLFTYGRFNSNVQDDIILL